MCRNCNTKPSTSSTTTAITLHRSSAWCAFASSAIAIRSAEKLAEKVGVAFQLTNILRDVKEDAGLGRVYLPREDFARFDIDVHALTNGSAPTAMRPLLEFEAQRAREFYGAAEELLPLIDEDSQPALWTLVEIYRRLLEKIIARNYDVFSERVRLSSAEKLSVMAKGFWRRA